MDVITSIEKQLIELLKFDTNAEVIPFPEDAQNYNLVNEDGAILVLFSGRNFITPRTGTSQGQFSDITFTLTVLNKYLSTRESNSDAYSLVQHCINRVSGFKPLIGRFQVKKPFQVVSTELATKTDADVWVYSVVVRLTVYDYMSTQFESKCTDDGLLISGTTLSASYADFVNIEANNIVVSDMSRFLAVVEEIPADLSGYNEGTIFFVTEGNL